MTAIRETTAALLELAADGLAALARKIRPHPWMTLTPPPWEHLEPPR